MVRVDKTPIGHRGRASGVAAEANVSQRAASTKGSRTRVVAEALAIEPPRSVLLDLPPLSSLARPGPAETLKRTPAGKLIAVNGVAVTKLEEQLRPGRSSVSGFLDDHERLDDVLRHDRAYLDGLGISAEKMAHLLDHAIACLGQAKRVAMFELSGSSFIVHRVTYRGYQGSPFADGCATPHDYTVVNLSRGVRMTFSGLMPELIGRYGFFEGNVRYRLAPQQIAEVFGLVEGKDSSSSDQRLWSGISADALRGLLPPSLQDALKYDGPYRFPFEPPPKLDERVVERLVKAVRRAPNIGTCLDATSSETLVRNCLAGSESLGVEGEQLYRQLAQHGAPETLAGVRTACELCIEAGASPMRSPELLKALTRLKGLLEDDPSLADLSDSQLNTLNQYIMSVRGTHGLTRA